MCFFKEWTFVCLVFFAVLCSAIAKSPMDDMVMSGFRLPEYDEEGQIVSQFFGKHAVYDSGGDVKITGVRMEFYRDEEIFLEVKSPHCFYNQKTRDAHSDAPITAEMDGFSLSGVGFHLEVG